MDSDTIRHRLSLANARASVPGTMIRSVALLALAACVGLPLAVRAADAPAAEATTGLEEVVVTARYATENLQRTPLSIASFNAERLAKDGITNLTDSAQTTSGVTFVDGGANYMKSMGALIRGVGQRDFIPALQPGVGVYIDDIYYGSLVGASAELGDVDRVEILKGPQGTLFGRNNEGGAVRVFNKKPAGDNSGYAELGYGDFAQRRMAASYDARITDTLFMRFTGAARSADGYIDQIDFACAHPTLAGNIKPIAINGNCLMGHAGSEDVKFFRVAARWMPQQNLEINLSGDSTTNYGNPAPTRLVHITPTFLVQLANTNFNIPHYGIPVDERFLPASFYQTYATDATFTDPYTGVYEKPVDNVSSKGLTGTLDWNASNGVHVKLITAYRKAFGDTAFKQGDSPIWVAGDWTQLSHDQTSAELRVNGTAFSKRLDWVTGAYYYKGNELLTGPVNINLLSTTGLPFFPPFFVFSQNNPAHSNSKSVFVHGVYHVGSKLGLEAGVRYTKDELSYTFDQRLILLNNAPLTEAFNSTPDSHVDPKLALQYQWTDQFMTYVSASKGYRSGGFNPRPLDPIQVTTFKPEYLTQYEIGEKGQWLDNRLRLNIAAYYSDYKDLQQQGTGKDLNGNPALIYTNVGSVHITGADVDVEAQPTENWLFDASVGVLDYKIVDLGSAAGTDGAPTLDSMAVGVPKLKGNVSGQYSWPLSKGKAGLRLAYTYQSKTYWDPPNSPIAAQEAYGLLNARLSWNSDDNLWETSLLVTNLAGKEYYSFLNNDTALWGTVMGNVGKPRQILFTVRRNLGGK
jgi:iron complex outermembrane receptor protein